MQNEHSFDTGELTLNYFEGGTGAPMVLLHGLTSKWQGLYPLIPALTAKWHVFAPDLRGHGGTGHAPDEQYHNADYARDVIAFLKHIGEPVALIGHSLGAMTAIVTASRYPEGVQALVLLDPPLFTYTDNVRLHAGSNQWFELLASVMKDKPSYDQLIERFSAVQSAEEAAASATWIAGLAVGTVETALRDELWQGVDLPRALQSIRCPTLLIHGDWDRGGAMRQQDVEFFKTNLPAAAVVRLPGADHGLRIQEQPDTLLEHFDIFLKST